MLSVFLNGHTAQHSTGQWQFVSVDMNGIHGWIDNCTMGTKGRLRVFNECESETDLF